MKKLTLLTMVMFCTVATISAQISFSIDSVYSYLYTVEKPLSFTDDVAGASWTTPLNQLFAENRNQQLHALGVGLDMHGRFVYTAVSIVYPFASAYQNSKTVWYKKIDTSHLMLDGQLGLGYNFGSKKKVHFYVGAGLALQVRQGTSKTNFGIGQLTMKSFDLMLGAGANMRLHWYFSKYVGLVIGLSDVFYFRSLKFDRTFSALGASVSITDKNKNVPQLSPAYINNLSAKLGFSFKF